MIVFAVFLLSLAACDEGAPDRSDDDGPSTSSTGRYQDAELLIDDLNDHLETSQRCDVYGHDLATKYAENVKYEDAAECRFSNGTPMTVMIVQDGESTYERHFEGSRGPFYYLWGSTWIVIAPLRTPHQALDALREQFDASGEGEP